MPKDNRRPNVIPIFVITSLVLLSLLSLMTLQAVAQGGGTPTPPVDEWYQMTGDSVEWNLPYFEPGTSSGEAEWILDEAEFASLYPRGFEISTMATSSAGSIVNASVIWSHTPNKLKRRDADIDPQTGKISYRWWPDDSLPPWVAVSYYWSFLDSAGNRFRSNWIVGNEYYDTRTDWNRTESEDVVVFTQDGLPHQTADLVLQAMDDQHATFIEAWGQKLPYKPRVILFSDRDDFGQWRVGFGGAGIIGQTSDSWGATVQVITNDDLVDLTYGTVLHEIAHLYQIYFAGDFLAGTWWNEGNATLFELNQQYDYEQRVRDLARNDQLPILFQGDGPSTFGAGPDGQGRYGYDVGYTFWRWLTINYGYEAHFEIIQLMAEGETRDQALETVTGLGLVTIETRWREWLGADGPPPTLFPTPTHLPFPPTMTPFIFPTRAADA